MDETHKQRDGKVFVMVLKFMANLQNSDFSGPQKWTYVPQTYRQELVEIEVLFFFGGDNL